MYLESNGTDYCFEGFTIQARTVAGNYPAGYFVISDDTEYELQCDNDVSACTFILVHS